MQLEEVRRGVGEIVFCMASSAAIGVGIEMAVGTVAIMVKDKKGVSRWGHR